MFYANNSLVFTAVSSSYNFCVHCIMGNNCVQTACNFYSMCTDCFEFIFSLSVHTYN